MGKTNNIQLNTVHILCCMAMSTGLPITSRLD